MANVRNQNIRWLLLVILLVQRNEGGAEIGGWITEGLLRRLLGAEGYPLTVEELRTFLHYLSDPTVGCVEPRQLGDLVDPTFKYRLTAQGIRVAEREIEVPGIGINRED